MGTVSNTALYIAGSVSHIVFSTVLSIATYVVGTAVNSGPVYSSFHIGKGGDVVEKLPLLSIIYISENRMSRLSGEF